MLSDFRFALRTLGKTPGFTVAAVIVLALGIGANSAIFSIVNALLFAPPSYAHPAAVVQVFSQDKKNPTSYRAFSYPTYRDIREKNSVFTDVFAHNLTLIGIGEKDHARRALAELVSSNYFSVLGVAPVQGRAFLPDEERPGSAPAVAIASYPYWQQRGFDPALVGSTVLISGRPYTIVGIAPENFTGTMQLFSPSFWLPLGDYDRIVNDTLADEQRALALRSTHDLMIVGRLKPGLTGATALPALATLAANLEHAFPVEQKDQTFTTAPLSRLSTSETPNDGDGDIATLGALLLGMSAVVLLVACLNLANMLLARGTARRKEIAIRLALGAGRARIIRQLLLEGFVLAVMGGVVGLVLALWSADLLVASLLRFMPFDLVWPSGLSPVVLGATFLFCVFGTLLFALGPALKLSRGNVLTDLKEQAGEDVAPRRWKYFPRHPLVVVQIALSLALLTAAALFIRGAGKAANVDTGLDVQRTWLVQVDASLAGQNPVRSRELYHELNARLAALPGVESASVSSLIPFGMVSKSKKISRAGLYPAADAKPSTAAEGLAYFASWNSVGADYFKSVGLPLLRGRPFTAAEATQPGGPAVAIIDESLARKLWPDGNALGQQLQYAATHAPAAKNSGEGGGINMSTTADSGEIKAGEPIQVVGIVPSTRHALFEKEVGSSIYLPYSRGFQSDVHFLVRFATLPTDANATTALLRRTVREFDATLPVLAIKSFPQHLDGNIQIWVVRAGAALFSVFGGLALGLAVVGIYGVKAYAVARRTREIGIRMALGAQPAVVLKMILREATLMLACGLLLGVLLAFGTGQLVSSLLYHVSATDPIAFTVAPVVLALAAFVAAWIPARRATRINPLTALRSE
ncbi:ABC transporter permease [Horticoccus luteus]|uniref:ABC transporter permease n=1 Tax=Horticoccus luteus TaxID=2862869 RepID=A0A8F9XN06_9BACT|nr:ABC transporter permease [Horticoccus luteus]QYM80664.1 ABC transporter permease [Horticoccus luteus]